MFEITFGAMLLLTFVAVWIWQTPSIWHERMTSAEIDHYMVEIEAHWVMPAADKAAFIARVRDWAAEDDGKPVLLHNLMRYYDKLRPLPPSIRIPGHTGRGECQV